MKTLNIKTIRIDGGTQSRVEINNDVVADYSDAINAGAEFPAVVVFNDGVDIWLADGFHRFHAHNHAGKTSIAADVRSGTVRDAILFSLGANGRHGQPPNNADKRKIVLTMLNDPEWVKWSDNAIAKEVYVSHPFVGKLRASLVTVTSDSAETERTYTTKHGTTAVMRTGSIGEVTTAAMLRAAKAHEPAKPVPQQAPNPEPEKVDPKEPSLTDQVREETGANDFDAAASEIQELRSGYLLVADENQRLLDENAALKADGTTEEQDAVQALIAELRETNRIQGLELDAVKVSRDTYLNENAQLKKQIKFFQRKLKELEA